jgi:hypothetical protein
MAKYLLQLVLMNSLQKKFHRLSKRSAPNPQTVSKFRHINLQISNLTSLKLLMSLKRMMKSPFKTK